MSRFKQTIVFLTVVILLFFLTGLMMHFGVENVQKLAPVVIVLGLAMTGIVLKRLDEKKAEPKPKTPASETKKAEPKPKAPASETKKAEPKPKAPASETKKPEAEPEHCLPDSLAHLLPDLNLIRIKSCGDGEQTAGRWLRFDAETEYAEEAFIQYSAKVIHMEAYSEEQNRINTVFATSYHPFFAQFTERTEIVASNMRANLSYRPSLFEVTQNALRVSLYSGYVDTVLTETPERIQYWEHYHDSFHDGGGSGEEEWCLYPAEGKTAGGELLHELQLSAHFQQIRLPDCKGYWFEEDHLYLLEPWGLPGVFEYYCYVSEKSDWQSPEETDRFGIERKQETRD